MGSELQLQNGVAELLRIVDRALNQAFPGWPSARADPDWRVVGNTVLDNTEIRPAVSRLAGIVTADSRLASRFLQPDCDAEGAVWMNMAMPLVFRYVEALQRANSRGDVAGELIVAALEASYRPTERRRLIGIVPDLRLTEELRLSDDLRVRQMTDEAKKHITEFVVSHPVLLLDHPVAEVEHSFDVPPRSSLDPRQPLVVVSSTVTAIQLVTGRRVQLAGWQLQGDLFASFGRADKEITNVSLWGDASLEQAQTPEVQSVWNAIMQVRAGHVTKPKKRASIALDRWHSVGVTLSDGERLIDDWIALEALYLWDVGAELSYRAKMRIAAHLGRSPEERVAHSDLLQRSYGLRSKIVHGSVAASELGSEDKNVVRETEGLLRRALLAALHDGDIDVAALDRSLVSGSGFGSR